MKNLFMDNGMKEMRIKTYPIKINGNLIVIDRLEEDGTLELFEPAGKPLYLHEPFEFLNADNAALVASIEISLNKKNEAKIKKIFYEHGYDSLAEPMIIQFFHFADFYGCSSAILDMKKN